MIILRMSYSVMKPRSNLKHTGKGATGRKERNCKTSPVPNIHLRCMCGQESVQGVLLTSASLLVQWILSFMCENSQHLPSAFHKGQVWQRWSQIHAGWSQTCFPLCSDYFWQRYQLVANPSRVPRLKSDWKPLAWSEGEPACQSETKESGRAKSWNQKLDSKNSGAQFHHRNVHGTSNTCTKSSQESLSWRVMQVGSDVLQCCNTLVTVPAWVIVCS